MRNPMPLLSLAAVGTCAHAAGGAECPPWRLAPADAPEGARYGYYVAIDEPWAAVGAYNNSGYPVVPPILFHWNGDQWEERTALDVACESGSRSISIDGDRVAVPTSCWEVRVFRYDGAEWSLEGNLIGNGLPHSHFGQSVHLRGDRCIVGDDDSQTSGPGRAFIFRYVDGAWGLETELTADDGEVGDTFGHAVSIDGETAVVGAWSDDIDDCVTPPACGSAGSIYVFQVADGGWQQRVKLHAPDESAGASFGAAVAVRGDVLVGTASGRHAAYKFRRSDETWQLDDTLNGLTNGFGWGWPGTSLANGLCVVGSHGVDEGRGEVWVWGADIRETLNAPNGMPDDWLGMSVGVGEQFAIAGAPGDDGTILNGGAAWVFPVLTSDAPDCNHNWVHDMIDLCNGSPDCNASGVPDECEMTVVSTDPPSGAIDARQPSSIDGGMAFGWDYFDVVFNSSAVELHPADFVVEELGAVGTPIDVLIVLPLGDNAYRLLLSSPIRPNRWTTVRNDCIGEIIRLGFLPGDVNADRLTRPLDILSLIDALNGVGVVRPIWSTDIDRSGLATPADILREIDLLNGAGAFDVFNGATLP